MLGITSGHDGQGIDERFEGRVRALVHPGESRPDGERQHCGAAGKFDRIRKKLDRLAALVGITKIAGGENGRRRGRLRRHETLPDQKDQRDESEPGDDHDDNADHDPFRVEPEPHRAFGFPAHRKIGRSLPKNFLLHAPAAAAANPLSVRLCRVRDGRGGRDRDHDRDAVAVRMAMVVVAMGMIVVAMVEPLLGARPARVFAEDQRFDRHRYGEGGNADAAEIDIIEIHQHHAVDDENLAFDLAVLAQDGTERLRDIAVEHDIDRPFRRDHVGKADGDAAGAGIDPLEGRRAAPVESERNLDFGALRPRRPCDASDGFAERIRIDDVLELERRLQDLQIAARQQHPRDWR